MAVVEVGTWVTRAGYIGDVQCTREVRSVDGAAEADFSSICRSGTAAARLWSLDGDTAGGADADAHARFIGRLVFGALGLPAERPIMLVVPEAWHARPAPALPALCGALLESAAPAVYFARPSVCWTLSQGCATAVVADAGYGASTVTAVVDGYALRGPDRGPRPVLPGGSSATRAFAAYLPPAEPGPGAALACEAAADRLKRLCGCVRRTDDDDGDGATTSTVVRAPDGAPLELSARQRSAPFEPIVAALATEVQRCANALDPETRLPSVRHLLCGGTARTPGLHARLVASLTAADPSYIRAGRDGLLELAESTEGAWCGASMAAASSSFEPLWISRGEWAEEGEGCLARKLF